MNHGELQAERSRSIEIKITDTIHDTVQTYAPANVMDYYTDQVGMGSAALTERLKEGPPSHIKKKAHKVRWMNGVQEQIALAKEYEEKQKKAQEAFMLVSQDMADSMTSHLEKPEDRTVKNISGSLGECLTKAKDFQIEKLVKGGDVPPELTGLGSLLAELKAVKASELSSEKALELVTIYRGLNLETEAAAAQILDDPAVIEQNETAEMRAARALTADPEACYTVLYNCVTTAILAAVNDLSLENVDAVQLALLTGMATASAVAAGTLYNSVDFKERRERRVETERNKEVTPVQKEEVSDKGSQEQPVETERNKEKTPAQKEATLQANRLYLRTGQGTQKKRPLSWPMAKYAELMEQVFENRLETMELEQLSSEVYQMQKKIESNIPKIRSLISGLSMGDQDLEPAYIRKSLLNATASRLGKRLLTEDLSQSEDVLLTEIKAARTDIDSKIKEEEKSRNANRDQMDKNILAAKEIIDKHITPLNRRRALDAFLANMGKHISTAATAAIILEAEEYVYRLNIYSPAIFRGESALQRVLKEAHLGPEFAGPVCARIRRNHCQTMEDALALIKNIEADIEQNTGVFVDAVKEIKLTEGQWSRLMDWKEEYIDLQDKSEFQKTLDDLLHTQEYAENENGKTFSEFAAPKAAVSVLPVAVEDSGEKALKVYAVIANEVEQESVPVKYRYVDATASTAWRGNILRPERRIERLNRAREVWKVLREKGYETEMLKFCAGEKVKKGEISEKAKTLLKDHPAAKYFDEGNKDPAAEMRLFAMDEVLLAEGKPAESLSKDDRDGFEKAINETAKWYLPRLIALEGVLTSLNATPDEIVTYRHRMAKLLAQLEPHGNEVLTDKQASMNREKFGVSSWKHALHYLKRMVDKQKKNISDPKKRLERGREAVEHTQKMRNKLRIHRQEFNGFPENIIMEAPETWKVIVKGSEEEMDAYIEDLRLRIAVPMRILTSFYPPAVAEQILMMDEKSEKGDIAHQIFSGVERTVKEWEVLYGDCYSQISSHTIKGESIDDVFDEILEKNRELAYYLSEILSEEGILMLMKDEKKRDEKLKAYKKNIKTNTAAFVDYVKEENINERDAQLLKLRVRGFILRNDPASFMVNLRVELPKYQKEVNEVINSVEKTKNVIEGFRKSRDKIARKQKAGWDEAKDEEDKLKELRRQRFEMGSPLIAAFGGTFIPSQKKVDAFREKLDKEVDAFQKEQDEEKKAEEKKAQEENTQEKKAEEVKVYPDAVRNVLFERCLSQKKMPEKAILKKEVVWLDSVYNKILDINFYGNIKLKGGIAQELLMSIYIRRASETNFEPTEEDLKEEFNRITKCYDLLDELDSARFADPYIEAQREDLLDCLTGAMYTMKADDFESFLHRRMDYMKTQETAGKIFDELLEERKELSETAKIRIKHGLREYFRQEIFKGSTAFNADQIRTEAKALLDDKNDTRYLEDINSKTLLGTASYGDLTPSEIAMGGCMDRKGFEDVLVSFDHKRAIEIYNSYDIEQRQLFALCVSTPVLTGNVVLPSAQIMRSSSMADIKLQGVRKDMENFISREGFVPEVNYSLAAMRLNTRSGKINVDVFNAAMHIVEDCTKARYAAMPRDWERMSDGKNLLREARRLSGEGSLVRRHADPASVNSIEEFKTNLLGTNLPVKSVERFKNLTAEQFHMFILALQNRTILDRSTAKNAEGVANEELRADFIESFKLDRLEQFSRSLTPEILTRALESLHSYQLRDDVDLRTRRLKTEDFAEGAFDRKHVIDLDLLDNALELVNQIEKEYLRLVSIRKASEVIQHSGNEKACDEYLRIKDKLDDKEHPYSVSEFEAYLSEQAHQDGKFALWAGYMSLNERDKALFVKALGSREILDISKVGIMKNRFGRGDRDYADPVGRNILLDEYFSNTLGKGGGVELDKGSYNRAITSALSTQIRDDIDFTEYEGNVEKMAVSNVNIFGSSRGTAVDWKLVARALQLVHRAQNERDTYLQDRELYVSQSNVAAHGSFEFESGYLRSNIHNAGNRFTRFFGRRVQATVEDYLNAPSRYIPVPLLNPMDFDSDPNDLFNDMFGTMADLYTESYGGNLVESFAGQELSEALGGAFETGGEHWGYINESIHVAKAVYNHGSLIRAKVQADQAAEEDAKKTQEAAKDQTAEEKALTDEAIARNTSLQEQAKTKAHERQNDAIIQTVSSVAGGLIANAVGDETGVIEKVCEEVGEFINFLRNYVNDKSSVEKYFKRRGEADALRASLISSFDENKIDKQNRENAKKEIGKISDLELIRDARGFENYTEMASFVGLNIVRSLLYCASEFNPQKRLRILAVSALAVLGKRDAIGKQDSDTAMEVYDALMGSDYR